MSRQSPLFPRIPQAITEKNYVYAFEEELNKPIDLSTCQTSWVRFGLLLSKDLLAYSVPGLIILEMPRPTSPLNMKKDILAETKYKVFHFYEEINKADLHILE